MIRITKTTSTLAIVLGWGMAAPASATALGETLRYSGAAFVPLNSATAYESAGAGCIYRTAGPQGFALDVQVPDAAVVESATVYYEDRSAEDLSLMLVASDGQGNELVLAQAGSAGIAGFGSAQVSLSQPVDGFDINLTLRALLPGDSDQLKLCGAAVGYQPPVAIGGTKFLRTTASAFVTERNFTSWVDDGGGCRRFSSAIPPFAYWNVDLEPGAAVEMVELFFFDQNAGALGEVLLRLLEQDFPALGLQTLAAVGSDSDDGYGVAGSVVDHTVSGRGLFLDWSQAISSSSLQNCGARITYRDAPAGTPQSSKMAGATFVPGSSRTRHTTTSGCINHRGAGTPGMFTRRLQPPPGATFAAMTVEFLDNDPDNDVQVALLAHDGLGGEATLATFDSADQGQDTARIELASPYTVNPESESYVLQATLEDGQSNANLLLCSAGVEYLRPDAVFSDGFEDVGGNG